MLFDSLQRLDLNEYASNSEMEEYTGIVLDKDDNTFKVVTGQFHDKKDFYEKLTKRGMIVRKVFEAKVWRWMEDNAPNNLTAYLMFSTAFSKWKGNNVLGDYYIKLLNDIPQLNREKVKGDPKTMGLDKTIRTDESVFTEAEENDNPITLPNKDYYRNSNLLKPAEVVVTPINTATGKPSKFIKPLTMTAYVKKEEDKAYDSRDIVDANFWWNLYQQLVFTKTGEAFPSFAPFDDFAITIDGEDIGTIKRTLVGAVLSNAVNGYKDHAAKAKDAMKDPENITWQPKKDTQTYIGADKAARKAAIRGDDEERRRLRVLSYDLQKKDETEFRGLPKHISQMVKGLMSHLKTTLASYRNGTTPDLAALQELIRIDRKEIQDLTKNDTTFAKLDPAHIALSKFEVQLDNIEAVIEKADPENLEALKPQLQNCWNKMSAFMSSLGTFRKPTQDAISAKYRLNNIENEPDALQRKADDQLNTTLSPNNPKRDGDYNMRFVNGLDRYIDAKKKAQTAKAKRESAELDEENVNSGVTAMYQTQPIGGQPMDVYPTNRGMVPVGGLFAEGQGEVGFNPILFDGDRLNPDVRAALLKVADKFMEKLDIELEPIDIYLTGSNSNYNYNEHSDIDLHIVYYYEDAGAAAKILSRYLIAQKKVFNSEYKIKIKGIPVEVGCEDLDHPLVAGGIYSVLNDKWLMKPSELPQLRNDKLPPYMSVIVNKIEKAIESHDSTIIGDLWKSLGQLRKDSLAKDGEYGEGNLMFKDLRANGYLDRLKQAYYDSESKELSLEALEEI